jgi:taurine dioxygenase
MSRTGTSFSIRKLAGNIGIEVSDISLSGRLDDDTVSELRHSLVSGKVLFFRDQGHLDAPEQVAFASRFGPVTPAHPVMPAVGPERHVHRLDSRVEGTRANSWHTDVTFIDRPVAISILRAEAVPDYGGDTMWANTAVAFSQLPAELKDLAVRLWIIHNNYETNREHRPAYQEQFSATKFEALHPMVQVLPESGEPALLLGAFARRILGFHPDQSTSTLRIFQDHITRPENVVRWRWEVGDVAMWDNRATQHYAINDYGDQPRIMERVTIAGDVPMSLDGRRSELRLGDTSAFLASVG